MQKETNGHKTTQLKIRGPKTTTPVPESIEVFSIEKQVITCTIVGLSQLICNNAKHIDAELEDDRRLSAEEKRAKKRAPKAPVIPEERYQRARHLDTEGRDCVPAYMIKAALVTAATRYGEIGVPGTVVRGALFVLGDLLPIKFRGVKPWPDLKPYLGDGRTYLPGSKTALVPVMRRDTTKVGTPPNKKIDLRYRPGYDDWSIDLRIEYEPKLISIEGLHHLVRRAGSSVGLCEWRPEKSPAGIFGRFDIAAGIEELRARS